MTDTYGERTLKVNYTSYSLICRAIREMCHDTVTMPKWEDLPYVNTYWDVEKYYDEPQSTKLEDVQTNGGSELGILSLKKESK